MSVIVIGDVQIVNRAQQSHELQEVSPRSDASPQSQDVDASSLLNALQDIGVPSKAAQVRHHTQIVHLRSIQYTNNA